MSKQTTKKKAARSRSRHPATIHQALAKAQAAFPGTDRDAEGENAGESYPYLTYDQLIKVTRKPLLDADIALTHVLVPLEDGSHDLVTELHLVSPNHTDQDEAKRVLRSTWRIPAGIDPQEMHPDPQTRGTWMTYGKRYTLGGLLGFATEPDDDAKSATPDQPAESTRKKASEYSQRSRPPKNAPGATDSQKDHICRMFDRLNLDGPAVSQHLRGASHGRADNVHDLSKKEAGALIAKLKELAETAAADQSPEQYAGEEDQRPPEELPIES